MQVDAYQPTLVSRAVVRDEGVVFFRGDDRQLIPWVRIRLVVAAEVGEPDGVRTVVFDVVADADSDSGALVYRFDADPIDAGDVARRIEEGVGKDRALLAMHSLAADGVALEKYPDLESFEAAVLLALGRS